MRDAHVATRDELLPDLGVDAICADEQVVGDAPRATASEAHVEETLDYFRRHAAAFNGERFTDLAEQMRRTAAARRTPLKSKTPSVTYACLL